jgi:hypothetical protein
MSSEHAPADVLTAGGTMQGGHAMDSAWWQLARGRGARWGVVALWILGAVLSYSALRDLAVMLGFFQALGDLFPLVIDVAVWVGSMNALEARQHGRRVVERYAWALVALYSAATVAGNALVASAEAVDPRLVLALGGGWAHAVSGVAHAAPAVTMILFAHLAGLLMTGRSGIVEEGSIEVVTPRMTAMECSPGRDDQAPWAVIAGRARGPMTGHDPVAVMSAADDGEDHGHVRDMSVQMTAAQARQAVIDLVRQRRAAGREVGVADVQRVTGRGPRQARRLLTLAAQDVANVDPVTPRPRLVEADA